MPIYIYHNEEKDEYREIYQSMTEEHVYCGENGDEDGWKRVFTVPNASIDAQVDPFSSKEFVQKTGNKKGTYGDLIDRSKEMSEKRAQLNGGVDPVKQKYFEQYSKERRGAKHPEQLKSYESKNVKIDYSSKR